MRRLSGAVFLACISILAAVAQQQIVDTDFQPAVAMPAYLKGGPTVAIDEAHDNFHTMAGQYAPLAMLLRNDGYKVVGSKVPFEKENLRGIDVLIIANARNLKAILAGDISKPAFTDHECDVIADWVRAGGSLLLIADHAPFGKGRIVVLGEAALLSAQIIRYTDPTPHDMKIGMNTSGNDDRQFALNTLHWLSGLLK